MQTIQTPRAKFVQALVKAGHDKSELLEMANPDLRDLYDDEFPTHITVTMPYRNGGTTRNTVMLSSPAHKKVA